MLRLSRVRRPLFGLNIRILSAVLWLLYVTLTVPCYRKWMWRFVGADLAVGWGTSGLSAHYWGHLEPARQFGFHSLLDPPGFRIESLDEIADAKTWFQKPRLELKHILIPHWILFPSITVFTITILKFPRTRRSHGHCARCDYNLKENLTGICPECGSPISAENRK